MSGIFFKFPNKEENGMSYTCGRNFSVSPDQVFPTIASNLLRDGFDIIIDMEKSKGSHIVNVRMEQSGLISTRSSPLPRSG